MVRAERLSSKCICYTYLYMQKTEAILGWKAKEFEHRPRSVDWYWIFGGVIVIIAALILFFGNFLFAMFILLAGLTIGLHAGKEPELNSYSLHEEGFVVNRTLYPYENIAKFWIQDLEHRQTLLLEIKRVILPVVTAPLVGVDISWVRQVLRNKNIKETEIEIPLAEQIMNSVGF